MKIPPRTLVGGVPAKVMRELSEEEIAWKLEGTLTYQDLTRRCLATMVEVTPLAVEEPDRPRLQAPEVLPLIAAKRRQ
jgi:phenylacetic acid degradation protein